MGRQDAAEVAVGLVAALMLREGDQVQPLLDDADPRAVAVLLAAVTALHLAEDFPDGVERLRRAGLAVAGADS